MPTLVWCDASVRNHHVDQPFYVAGGAAYVKSRDGPLKISRVFRVGEEHPIHEAETRIIYLACRTAYECKGEYNFAVYTDSEAVRGVWRKEHQGWGHSKHGWRRESDRLRSWANNEEVSIEMRWVKAHQSGTNLRAHLNRLVDKKAREVARQYEHLVLQEEQGV